MSAVRNVFESVGRGISAVAEDVGYQIDLLFRVLLRLGSIPKRWALIADQLYQSGVKTVYVVLLVGLFMGMIVSFQTGIELARFGQQDQIGTIVALSMCREMGPFITAIILAATVGSALAAELGTMAVNDELAALEVMSIDRLRFLIVPRVVALAVIAPTLTVLCDTVGVLGGSLVAGSQLNVGVELYFDSAIEALQTTGRLIELPKDVYTGLVKAVVFGIIVAIISCAAGLRATAGAIGVGNATRKAVRDSTVAIIISNYFMTWFFFQT